MKAPVICVSCKKIFNEITLKCDECKGSTFSETHESNANLCEPIILLQVVACPKCDSTNIEPRSGSKVCFSCGYHF